ncbi:glycosyltransferase family 4 protein [Rahnella sp. PD12R]|uniref:glycosyltransferase family 4 protein n=1 Tax=Rahnella sp. PD12R TaxID=2855688 RepID=UPI001C4902F4|nr:glycosyltransferase family 1 protein [Rahnella sp. PD12R]MBV6821023.1 glycosyltransferase family 4 protein [Rahnella sp. PD12R]
MVKILYDARWIGEHGIGRFANEVFERNNGFIKIKSNLKPTSPLDVVFITLYLAFNKGVYFSPGYNCPFLFLNRSIITIHDLNHIDIDHNSSFMKKLYYEWIMKRACRKSLKVLTVSNFSKKRICEWSGIESSKVIVVGNGVSDEFAHAKESEKNDQEEYILVVSNRKKHKNESRILSAFGKAAIPQSVKLVFTGNSTGEIEKEIESKGLQGRIVFKGRVENNELARLYQNSLFLLFPSLYEGFGLPVIEAMSSGTAVITSNTTSLPEVAGDAALLVDPESIEEISGAINNLYFNKNIRDELIEKGLKQAKKYSWATTSDKIKCFLNELSVR